MRPGTTTCSYVGRMWLWDNWQKLLYFLQRAGMFVARHDATQSTMVFQHCTNNSKFYFKAFFWSRKYWISPFFRNKPKHSRSLKVIFFSVVDNETIFMWDEWYFPLGKPWGNLTLVNNYIQEQDHPLNEQFVMKKKVLANRLRNITQILSIYLIKN